jgi:hypothetical protein
MQKATIPPAVQALIKAIPIDERISLFQTTLNVAGNSMQGRAPKVERVQNYAVELFNHSVKLLFATQQGKLLKPKTRVTSTQRIKAQALLSKVKRQRIKR